MIGWNATHAAVSDVWRVEHEFEKDFQLMLLMLPLCGSLNPSNDWVECYWNVVRGLKRMSS